MKPLNLLFVGILGASISACYISIPAYPKIISFKKSNLVPSERLFNQEKFVRNPGSSELRIIRDVGSEFRNDPVLISIDSIKFAEIQPWESTVAFLPSGNYTIKIGWPNPVPFSKWEESLVVDCYPGSTLSVRIELGRPKPQIRLTSE